MKLVRSKSIGQLCGTVLFVCIPALVLVHVAGYSFHCKYMRGIAAEAEVDKYEVRSELLMMAMDYVGICDPRDAVSVWAEGLIKRNAAMQYSVMSEKLRNEYARQLEENAPNWVTGMSSPWVDRYSIVKMHEPNPNRYLFDLCIFTMSSAGPGGDYVATLTVEREGDFWRITDISADKELNAYMGYTPEVKNE